ncbi:hypothetical protein AVEN_53611-1 [Araneus ventricosus]|uniref:Uncharacterized protein n=1 Tax=Araneus ventricosus TaxID=182803 RepID=A0A4Y2NHF3_ARAVE|nr:hypothetical protein AVEN_53611-1 [Araneus ventricosus]
MCCVCGVTKCSGMFGVCGESQSAIVCVVCVWEVTKCSGVCCVCGVTKCSDMWYVCGVKKCSGVLCVGESQSAVVCVGHAIFCPGARFSSRGPSQLSGALCLDTETLLSTRYSPH